MRRASSSLPRSQRGPDGEVAEIAVLPRPHPGAEVLGGTARIAGTPSDHVGL